IFKLDVVHTHQLPALGSGDFICVVRAQIPRVGIFLFYERAYNCSLFTVGIGQRRYGRTAAARDRKSTRLNSSHVSISYAVFCCSRALMALTALPTRRSSDLHLQARCGPHAPAPSLGER